MSDLVRKEPGESLLENALEYLAYVQRIEERYLRQQGEVFTVRSLVWYFLIDDGWDLWVMVGGFSMDLVCKCSRALTIHPPSSPLTSSARASAGSARTAGGRCRTSW